ncbi:MAG: DUF2490 domain-containing protein [Polyangiaceae bacterium]
MAGTRLVGGCLLAAATFASTPARADGEAWFWIENRLPVVRTEKPGFPRLDWRFVADFRLNSRSKGLAQSFLRTGPVFYPTSFLFVAMHGTIQSDRLATGRHDEEARVEFEPNLFGRVGDFTWNDRNRLEWRWRESGDRWRYRNQLRINYAPVGAKWIPFVWDELLIDLSGLGLNQNRAQIGMGRMVGESTRIDLGYMVRSREDAGAWIHDHVLNLYVFFDAKPLPPTPTPPVPPTPPAPRSTGLQSP